MQAKTREHYEKVWNEHINELTSLLCESNIPQKEWQVILLPLYTVVIAVATKLEKEGHWENA